ncbi:hypothetical protein ASO20_02085 [Mycoplasma sp. (ex Biomphalaria glabrata)]|nr:hypothetical protein ASO20_02085 [Mycoplasma sp. (ex Biomphalaria glabrata)]
MVFPTPMIIGILWLVLGIEPKWAATFFFIMPILSLVVAIWIFKSIFENKFGDKKSSNEHGNDHRFNGSKNDSENIQDAEIIEE